MAAQVMCPNLRCRKILSVPDDARGRIVKCQACQTLLKVPEPKPASPTPKETAAK
jgi:LSD1 subclass zinc finger protein